MRGEGTAIFCDAEAGGWICFDAPHDKIVAHTVAEVAPALERLRAATERGEYAAGWIAYEAAPGFDAAMVVHSTGEGTSGQEGEGGGDGRALLCFWLYKKFQHRAELAEPAGAAGFRLTTWEPQLSREDYTQRIARIRELIAAGDTYQVNLTFPLHAQFEGDPWAFFHALNRAQRGRHHAYINGGDAAIVSASPELFFAQDGDRVVTRPMKGTRPRGLWAEDDERLARELAASAKDRAENVMIVDLLRNDLSRVARPGSVVTEPLFEVERLESVLQMTSTIRAETDGDPLDTLRALFPCGSVTGAPKIHTMKLIAELEGRPRGLYTGAIGWLGPGRRAAFSVAIRTVELDLKSGRAVFGVGSGVTWDSSADAEYDECLLKSRLLAPRMLEVRGAFELLETMSWDPEKGFALFARHLARLEASAHYFQFKFDRAAVCARVHEWSAGLPEDSILRTRLRLTAEGTMHLESAPVAEGSFARAAAAGPIKIGIARTPVRSDNVFLYHKTTERGMYHQARAECPRCDDALLINERGELTETSIANLVVELDGKKYTPPRTCGLLGGTMREDLLHKGEIEERVLTKEDLARATGVWLINSVRGWMRAEIDF